MKKTLLFFLSLCMILTFANLRVNTASALENNIITDMESDVSAETSVIGNYAEIPPTQFGTIENGEIIWKESGSAGEAELMSTTSFICDTYSLLVSETASLLTDTIPSGTTVTWSSQNTDIATVSSSGVVTGVKAGTARINASVNDGTSTVVKQVSVYVIIENGVYYIKNNATSKYLHVNNSSIAENAGLVVSTKLTSDPARLAQLWRINYLGEGCYSIRPMHKLDMCLQRYGLGVAIGTRGTTENVSDLSGLAQWRISGVSSGYKLDSRSYTSQYLYVNGTAVSLGGTSNSVWSLEKLSSVPSGVLLYNTQSWIAPESTVQFVAAVYSGSTLNQGVTWTSSNTDVATVNSSGVVTGVAAGTSVITAKSKYNSGWSKSFTVNVGSIPNGIHYIQSKKYNKKVVDIKDSNTAEGESIHQFDFEGTDDQKWIFELQQDGYYTIKSVYSNLYLSVKENSTDSGAEVVQNSGGNADGQRWKIIQTSSGAYKLKAKCAGTQDLCLMKGTYLVYPNKLVHMTYTNNDIYDDEWMIIGQNDYTLMYIGNAVGDPLMPPILNTITTSLHNNANMHGYEFTSICTNDLLIYLSSSSIFSCITHGTQTTINTSDGKLTITDINSLSNTAFDNLRFVYLGACLTGKGRNDANNLVNALYSKGADTVLGFTIQIYIIEANLWTEVFMTTLSNGFTINHAMNEADQAVMNNVDCQELPYYSTSSTYRYLLGSGGITPCA